MAIDSLSTIGDLIATQVRKDQRHDNKLFQAWVTTAPYLVIGPINLAVILVVGVLGMDHATFMELVNAASMDLSTMFYQTTASTVGLSYYCLFVTLRDKGLISKDTEILLTSVTLIFVLPVILNQPWTLSALALAAH